jgi:hypothetical protein
LGEWANLVRLHPTTTPELTDVEAGPQMSRIVASGWFLASTAVCCAIAVGLMSWIASDSSAGIRALAAVIGLGAALAVMLLVAWVLAAEPQPERGVAVPETSTVAIAPIVVAPGSVEPDELALRLEEGSALRESLEPGSSDDRVTVWIEEARATIAKRTPGAVGYFDALAARAYADDRERLDAHLGRVATIVRDFQR